MTEIEVRKLFSTNLKKLRKQRNLSQLKLANELQMAMTFISDIENCKKWVSPETLAKFATFFNVPISSFFAEDEPQEYERINFLKIIAEELHNEIDECTKRLGQTLV